MFFIGTPSLAYHLVIICCLAPRLSASQTCLTESLEDVVIDIQSSLSKGIRGNEPIHTVTQGDCIDACCSTKNIAGDKACNLMIFDTRKTASQSNCYLFYCPNEEACPLKPAEGLMSYRVIRDFPSLSKADFPLQKLAQEDSLLPGQSSRVVTPTVPPPTGDPKPTGLFWRDVFSRTVASSAPLYRLHTMDGAGTRVPVYKEREHSPHFQVSLKPETAPVLSENSTTVAVASFHVSATLNPRLPPLTSPWTTLSVTLQPLVGTTAPSVTTVTSQPPTAPMSTNSTFAVVTPQAAVTTMSREPANVKGSQEMVPSGGDSKPGASSPGGREQSIATLTLSNAKPSFASKTASQDNQRVIGDSWSPSKLPEGPGGLSFEKWLLVGTLLFGILFLIIGLVILGRMLAESLRRKRYSRLDYLINGIYVDI